MMTLPLIAAAALLVVAVVLVLAACGTHQAEYLEDQIHHLEGGAPRER